MAAMTRAELDQAIGEALAANPALRDQLREDPRAVIGAIAGMEVPDVVAVTVHEESYTEIHIVLPAEGEVVSEEDLSLVSGGWNPGPKSMCGTSCGTCSV